MSELLRRVEDALVIAGLVGSLAASAWKSIDQGTRDRFERQHPTAANWLRLLTAAFVDSPKVFRVFVSILAGVPWRVVPPGIDPDKTPPHTPSSIRKRAEESK